MSQLQSILQMKEKLSKQKILERLFGKKDPLSEVEESLKLKLMNELFMKLVRYSSRTCEPSHGCVWNLETKVHASCRTTTTTNAWKTLIYMKQERSLTHGNCFEPPVETSHMSSLCVYIHPSLARFSISF
ncbi:hypothetical protein YC2023_030290 [Brassica napus]